MALLVALVKLAHVFAGFWLVAGLVGRGVTQVKAERTADIGTVKVLIELIGRFDSLMVIPASTAVLALGLVAAWIEGLPILGFLQGAHTNWLLVALVLYLSIMVLVPTCSFLAANGLVRRSTMRYARATSPND